MVHNHYLEEAKKKTQESSRNSEPIVMPFARSQSIANGSKPEPRINNQKSRNWPASKTRYVTTKTVPIAEHSRNSRKFSDSKHFVCSTCQKCVFNANHDSCVAKFLNEVNLRAKVPSNETTNRNKTIEQISFAKKPKRQIPKGHRFSIKKTSVVHTRTMTLRSCLRWKPTGKIFKIVGLRWVPTGKIFTSSTTKVDTQPLNGSNEDITNQYEYEQTLDVSATTLNLSAELEIHNHSNESSSSKLFPKVVPPADKTATSRQNEDGNHALANIKQALGEDTSLPPPPPIASPEAPQMVSSVKLHILKNGEYILLTMKVEHYLAHTDYALWEVILNGTRERKAKSTLFMAIPDEHLARFHGIKDAKTLWAGIQTRFSGNFESKKMQKNVLKQQFEIFYVSNSKGLDKGYDRFQRLLSLLEIHRAGVSTEYANQKFLRSLPSAWSNISLIMRNKPDIDNLDIDDLYNNLKVYEVDIKGSSRSSYNSQNMAFVSSESTSSTNELNAAYNVSTTTGHSSQAQGSSSYAIELMFSFFANQHSSPQLDNEDLEQINQDDLEEMDFKWQVAMLSMRVKRFYKKIRRKLKFNGKEPVGFDKAKVECFNCHERGRFSRDYRSVRNSGNMSRDAGNAKYRGRDNVKMSAKEEDEKALALQVQILSTKVKTGEGYDSQFNEKEVRDVKEEEVTETVFDNRSSDEENSLANDKFKKVFTRSGRIPVSAAKLKATASTSAVKPVNNAGPKQSVNFSKSRSTFHKSHSPIRRSFYNATAHSRRNSTDRVNTTRPRVNDIDQLSKDNRWICTRVDYVDPQGHPQQALKNKGIVKSGCSRHMTGNKAYLADYQEINDGGFVAFGSSRGKITSKGNQTNKNAGPQDTTGNAEKEASDAADALRKESEQGCMDQRGTTKAGNTNSVNTVSNLVNAASTSGTFSPGGPSSPHPDAFIHAYTLLHIDQDDSQIPDLKDTADL
uniref:Uncharacterized protein n=1 Tax=Tanacetum cinerariifolium TaxID=118510 RepID=A0A6L2LW18_TANCI|nr:hypothetical protein [Tanacetum cinerariifolium]